jgi:hypothetical protein
MRGRIKDKQSLILPVIWLFPKVKIIVDKCIQTFHPGVVPTRFSGFELAKSNSVFITPPGTLDPNNSVERCTP